MKGFFSGVSVILAFAVLFGATLSCNFNEVEERTNLFHHYYAIEPETLLDMLESGNTNVFSPISEEPSLIPSSQQIPVSWRQDDYFTIANALFKYVWGETLDGWQLHTMDFALGCTKIDFGFQNGNFEFFRISKTNGRESRIVRIVNIDPRSKFIFVTENEYAPKLVNWSSIGFVQNQLSADEIMQIADNDGGQEKRVSVENACDISMWLAPDSADYNGWEVNYTRRDDGTSMFRIQIDPYTGEIH
jgi:hypothetical protein